MHSRALSRAVNKYDKILIAEDFNIFILNENDESTSYFFTLWDTFKLKKLVTNPTCYKSLKGTIIYLRVRYRHANLESTDK